MILLSFVLCLALTLSVIVKPLNTHAVVGLDDLAIICCYVIASVALGSAIDVAVRDPVTLNSLKDCYDNLSAPVKGMLEDHVKWLGLTVGATTSSFIKLIKWDAEFYSDLAHEVCSWFSQHNDYTATQELGITMGDTVLTNENNLVGFTSDSSFKMYFPSGAKSAVYPFNTSVLTIYRSFDKNTMGNSDFNAYNGWNGWMLRCDNGIAYVRFGSANANISGAYIIPHVDSSNQYFALGFNNGSWTWCFTCAANWDNEHDGNGCGCFYDFNLNKWAWVRETSDGAAIYVDSTRITDWYPNKKALYWGFFEDCGFKTALHNTNVNFTPQALVHTGVSYDADSVSAALESLDSRLENAESITTAIPVSDAGMATLADNPTAVYDNNLALELDAYPADFPLVSSSPALWQTKFPFCLPWDLYNVIAGFNSEAVAPSIHMPIITTDIVPVLEEDVYFDLDFSDYSDLVRILRFFFCALFTIFLILITRKIIGGG